MYLYNFGILGIGQQVVNWANFYGKVHPQNHRALIDRLLEANITRVQTADFRSLIT